MQSVGSLIVVAPDSIVHVQELKKDTENIKKILLTVANAIKPFWRNLRTYRYNPSQS